MDEIIEDVNGDSTLTVEDRTPYGISVTEIVRAKALEWFDWEIEVEVTSDGYTLSAIYPPEQLEEGRRKIQAAVLNNFIASCPFDATLFFRSV